MRTGKEVAMGERRTRPEEEVPVACAICMKEIPLSEAQSEEADDYVRHFCGLDCYAKWRAQTQEVGEMPHPDDD
jgi:hypothetical protein